MRKKSTRKVILWLMAMAYIGQAQSGGTFSISRYTIDGGGSISSGGSFSLKGSIGQPDAGEVLSGDIYRLNGGFWKADSDIIFRDGFE
ncbi:hypothetical protein [Marinicella sp. W31]|uniref:hypothetical protein n=1 Tax=Marinicella sp. W31 TaxID=3023713 RepID=UPI003756A462